jgi:hypothetical protein
MASHTPRGRFGLPPLPRSADRKSLPANASSPRLHPGSVPRHGASPYPVPAAEVPSASHCLAAPRHHSRAWHGNIKGCHHRSTEPHRDPPVKFCGSANLRFVFRVFDQHRTRHGRENRQGHWTAETRKRRRSASLRASLGFRSRHFCCVPETPPAPAVHLCALSVLRGAISPALVDYPALATLGGNVKGGHHRSTEPHGDTAVKDLRFCDSAVRLSSL